MSWTGTVRCSICHRSGHNKSGCPQVAEEYEECQGLIAKYNADNPDIPDITDGEWISYSLKEEIGLNWKHMRSREIVETKKNKNTTRQCTYCGEVGHNRRTCTALKTDIDLLVKASTAYNKRLAKAYELSGLYVGGLLQHKTEEYDYNKNEYVKENVVAVITEINLQSYNVMHWLTQDWQQHRSIKLQGSNGKTYLLRPNLPKGIKEELFVGYAWDTSDYMLLSSKDTPVPPHVFNAKEHRKYIKEYLKDLNKANVKQSKDRIAALIGGVS